MKDRVREAIKRSRSDYTEIRLERSWGSTVAMRGDRLEGATAGMDEGGCVRALNYGYGWGITSFTSLDQLSDMVARAHALSRAAPRDEAIPWAAVPICQDDTALDLDGDVRGVSLEQKCRYVERLNDAMAGYDRRVVSTRVAYRDEVTEYWFANSEGTLIHQVRPEYRLSAVAVAREHGNQERTLVSVGQRKGWDSAFGRDDQFREAAARAVDLLGAERVAEGRYPVVLDPTLAGVITHEAIGHLAEADLALDDPAVAEMLPLGRRVGPSCLTVVDDGRAPGLRGALPFDDEGTPTQKTLLIQNGEVVGRLHSRETAAAMGELPTGNARALSYRHPPIVRMTNTYIAQGSGSLEDLLGGIELGVYACDAAASRTHLDTYTFTAGHGRMIRNGQLAELVRGVTLSGNLFDMLGSIEGVSGQFQWNESGGGCGKKGQSPLPVADGAPHVRVASMAVGKALL